MPDPLTTIIVTAGGALASKDILTKLLGPTADLVGEGSRDLVKRGAENMGRIFRAFYAKVKGKTNDNGQVNPRVFKSVWDDGPFVEDVFTAEYFGGLLASARTVDGKDDTAIPMAALVRSLSADQLRLHFVVYSILARRQFDSETIEAANFWSSIEVKIPADELVGAMVCPGFDGQARLLLALTGLVENRLVGERHALRIGSLVAGNGKFLDEDSLVAYPNERGACLFLRALGLRGLHPELITSIQVEHSLSDVVKASIQLPVNASCRRRSVREPFERLESEVGDQVSEFESELDDVKDQLSELDNVKEELADIKNQLDELLSRTEDADDDVQKNR